MKNFIIAFLVFLIWSFFGLWLYSWLNPVKQNDKLSDITPIETNEELPLVSLDTFDPSITDTLNLSENIQNTFEEKPFSKGLRATNQNGDVIFLFSKGISIFKDTSLVVIPPEIVDFKYKINTYLVEHPKEEVQILALYAASEKIKNPNLGIRRGNKIRDILESVNIPREKLAVKSMIKDFNFDENGLFPYGISFNFKPLDTVRLNSLKFRLPEDKTIYPKLVNNDIFVNDALKELLEEVKNVLSSNPNVRVEIVGHTDNIGNANDNYVLALKYSQQVRWYLINRGKLDKDRVLALSEGESKSIANNNTSEGQFLNRRIEVKYRAN
jgi:outer membrane protein OmpA-like peptidoglycan-associated protein